MLRLNNHSQDYILTNCLALAASEEFDANAAGIILDMLLARRTEIQNQITTAREGQLLVQAERFEQHLKNIEETIGLFLVRAKPVFAVQVARTNRPIIFKLLTETTWHNPGQPLKIADFLVEPTFNFVKFSACQAPGCRKKLNPNFPALKIWRNSDPAGDYKLVCLLHLKQKLVWEEMMMEVDS